MPDYRIYEIGQDGHVVRLLIELTLASDVIAIAYRNDYPLWKQLRFGRKRLVDNVRFSPSPPNVAA